MRIRRSEDGQVGDIAENLDGEEAVSLILNGKAVLDEVQITPPEALLDRLFDLLASDHAFGSEANKPKTLNLIAANLVKHGLPATLIEGHPVNWLEGKQELVAGAKDLLGHVEGDLADLFSQIEAALRKYVFAPERKILVSGSITEDEARERCLVRRATANFLDRTCSYRQLNPPWFDFYERMEVLNDRLESLLQSALAEGRIIVCEKLDNGSRVLHPTQVAEMKLRFGKKNLTFCFSEALPPIWFWADVDLHKRRNLASKWMKKVYLHFAAQGRRATVKDVKIVAAERFALKANATKDAWKKASSELVVDEGNPSPEIKVSLNEIRAIE